MKMNRILAALALTAIASAASADTGVFDVISSAYSTNTDVGGAVGLPTFSVTQGETLTFSSALDDTWNIYAGNAGWTSNGFGLANSQNSTLPFNNGALVGRIDSGDYFLIGAGTFSTTADATGELSLYVVDTNHDDNVGDISVTVSAVPEPANVALLLAGFGVVGFMARRRKS